MIVICPFSFQIERRISAFIERKQKEVDDCNVRHFCNVMKEEPGKGLMEKVLVHPQIMSVSHGVSQVY